MMRWLVLILLQLSIAREHLVSHGAQVFGPNDLSAESCTLDKAPVFLLTPHDITDNQLPSIPEPLMETAIRVTDWWVEICISTKTLVLPAQNRFCAPFFKSKIAGTDHLLRLASLEPDMSARIRQPQDDIDLLWHNGGVARIENDIPSWCYIRSVS
jgi:hypothetical protein